MPSERPENQRVVSFRGRPVVDFDLTDLVFFGGFGLVTLGCWRIWDSDHAILVAGVILVLVALRRA